MSQNYLSLHDIFCTLAHGTIEPFSSGMDTWTVVPLLGSDPLSFSIKILNIVFTIQDFVEYANIVICPLVYVWSACC